MKYYRGIKNPQFKKIIRTKDEKGNILTYKVKHKWGFSEHNTLKEARVMAIKIK